MTSSQQTAIRQIEMHWERIGKKARFSDVALRVMAGDNYREVLVDMVRTLAVENLPPCEVHYPATWWEHFKYRFFPAWALARWPVRYTSHRFRVRCYHPDIQYPDRNARVFFVPIVDAAPFSPFTEPSHEDWREKMQAVGPHLAGRDTAFVEAVKAKMLRGHVEHGQSVAQLVDAGEYSPELLDAFVYPSLYEWAGRITPATAQRHREAAYRMWQDLQEDGTE